MVIKLRNTESSTETACKSLSTTHMQIMYLVLLFLSSSVIALFIQCLLYNKMWCIGTQRNGGNQEWHPNAVVNSEHDDRAGGVQWRAGKAGLAQRHWDFLERSDL